MREYKELIGQIAITFFLAITIILGIIYYAKPKPIEFGNNIRQELIKELDTNKKIVVFEFEKFTNTIEEEQEMLELFINDGLDRNYIISTIEVVDAYRVNDRIILIFENGY